METGDRVEWHHGTRCRLAGGRPRRGCPGGPRGRPGLLRRPDAGQRARPDAAAAAEDAEEQLGAIVSGLVALAEGTSRVLDMGAVRQEIVTMAEGYVVAMSISDGSCLGVHAGGSADLGVIAYQMTSFVRRAGHVLTPALRAQMHQDRGGGRVGS